MNFKRDRNSMSTNKKSKYEDGNARPSDRYLKDEEENSEDDESNEDEDKNSFDDPIMKNDDYVQMELEVDQLPNKAIQIM